MESTNQLHVGMMVMTSDGHELGRIKSLTDSCLKVDIMLGQDFWIGRDSVREVIPGTVYLLEARDYFEHVPSHSAGHRGLHVLEHD